MKKISYRIHTSFWKLEFPGTNDITLAKWNEHKVDKIHNKANVKVVGINPDLWYKDGKFNIAGPVNELTAMEILPNIPMVPIYVYI